MYKRQDRSKSDNKSCCCILKMFHRFVVSKHTYPVPFANLNLTKAKTLILVSPPQPTTKQLKHSDTACSLVSDEDRKSTLAFFLSPGM